MSTLRPRPDPRAILPDVDPARIPAHVAIIMDGNGRWATQRGFPREFGHRAGAASVRAVVEECYKVGVRTLTLYSFSTENWKRPKDEVDALMRLCVMYLEGEQEALVKQGVRLRVIGKREGLPEQVVAMIDRVELATASCDALTLCLAINYSARAEIVDAAKELARRAASGALDPAAIDEPLFETCLTTAGIPDPDLLVRTAGEMRVSNFLLWQISYAELVVTKTLWPDFGAAEFHDAIREYAGRTRRFGAVVDATTDSQARAQHRA